MKRMLSIWFPQLAVERWAKSSDLPPDAPVVLTVEGTNSNLEVTAPAAGIVQEVNEAAKDEPDMVSDDPLEEGWLVKIEIQDKSDLKEFAS